METVTFFSFIYGFGVFLSLTFLQILIWNFFEVKKVILSLFLIFLVLPLFIGGGLFLANQMTYIRLFKGFFTGQFLLVSLGLAYIQTFPAIQAKSPTLLIMLFLLKKKDVGGASKDEIFLELSHEKILEDRVEDLKKDLLAKPGVNESMELTWVGKLLAILFISYRRLLGLPTGQG